MILVFLHFYDFYDSLIPVVMASRMQEEQSK